MQKLDDLVQLLNKEVQLVLKIFTKDHRLLYNFYLKLMHILIIKYKINLNKIFF